MGEAFESGAEGAFGAAGTVGDAAELALVAGEEADDEVGFAEGVGLEDEGFARASGHGEAGLRAQLLPRHERYNLVLGSALSFFGRRKNCPDIEAVFGGLLLANAADFVDDRVFGQFLLSQQFPGVQMTGHSNP
jgi:hypothetical protein